MPLAFWLRGRKLRGCQSVTDLLSARVGPQAETQLETNLGKGRLLSSNIGELTRRSGVSGGYPGTVVRPLSKENEGSAAETLISRAGDFFALQRTPTPVGLPPAGSATGGGW